MRKLVLPQLKLQKAIKLYLEYIRNDFKYNKEEETFLYKILGDSDANIGVFDYYEQAKYLFTLDPNEHQGLDVKYFFDSGRCHLPTIHITLPSENPNSDGIGFDEGFQEGVFYDSVGEYATVFTRRFETQYNLLITSSSPLEVLLIYEVLRMGLIGMNESLSQWGLENISLSGQDITINQSIVPANVFVRNLGVTLNYEVDAPGLIKETTVKDLIFNYKLIINNNG